MKCEVNFERNGVKFHAERGMASAEKDGQLLWSAMDVFKERPPTIELVYNLHKMLTRSWYLKED